MWTRCTIHNMVFFLFFWKLYHLTPSSLCVPNACCQEELGGATGPTSFGLHSFSSFHTYLTTREVVPQLGRLGTTLHFKTSFSFLIKNKHFFQSGFRSMHHVCSSSPCSWAQRNPCMLTRLCVLTCILLIYLKRPILESS